MRILLITQHWYPENGVPQRRWSWLTEVLTGAGHEVVVLAPPPAQKRRQRAVSLSLSSAKRRGRDSEPGPSGETIYRTGAVDVGNSLSAKAIGQLAAAASQCIRGVRLSRRINADLIIGTVPALPTAMVTYLLARAAKVPYVIDLRDAWPDLMGQSDQWNESVGPMSVRERIARRGPLQVVTRVATQTLNKVLREADAVTVTSSSLQTALLHRPVLARGGKHPRIEVIRNVFPAKSRPKKHLATLERSGNELNVLYAGTIGRAQNLQNAIDAAKIAAEEGLTVNLAFVGAGAARESVAAYAEELDVNASFEQLKPAEELSHYYEWADTALVHLTEWEPLRRTVPSKTYELMSNRIHISGVVVGEAAEIIQEFGSGDVVNPEEPKELAALWTELAKDRQRLMVSEKGGAWVRQQREEVVPELLLDLIEEIHG